MTDASGATKAADLPQANVRPTPRHRWVWLLPVLALACAAFLYYTHLVEHGRLITIQFSEGHGLKVGDTVRCRGITVGVVEQVKLTEGLDGVIVRVRMSPDSRGVARAGSRFWVVRPRFNLTGVGGLDTITGPRYIAALPADDADAPQDTFTGLDDAPVMATEPAGGLEVFLYGQRRSGLRAGAPITYRQFRVGTIASVGLTSDASSVEVRAYIRPGFTRLVRSNTEFWVASGAGWNLGLSGLNFEMDSIRALIEGGVAMATPSNAGEPVNTGHRYTLHSEPNDQWLEWQPALAVGSELLPDDTARPTMIRAVVTRDGGRFWSRTYQEPGWLLPTPLGLLGPADLVRPPDGDSATAVMEVDGKQFDLKGAKPWQTAGVALWPHQVQDAPWPTDRMRRPNASQPEDCVVIADPSVDATPIAAARFKPADGRWQVDQEMSFGQDWHGAAVLSRRDGQVIGVLLVKKGQGAVALVPEGWPPKVQSVGGGKQSATIR